MMRLVFLPVNQAWTFIFGNDVRTASVVGMDTQMFFESRKAAIRAADNCGLQVAGDGLVFAEDTDYDA